MLWVCYMSVTGMICKLSCGYGLMFALLLFKLAHAWPKQHPPLPEQHLTCHEPHHRKVACSICCWAPQLLEQHPGGWQTLQDVVLGSSPAT